MSIVISVPQLLSPAGSLAHLHTACDFGADAVYVAHPGYALRARNNAFNSENLALGIAAAQQRGKQVFVTSNVLAHHEQVRTYLHDLAPIVQMRPDGLVMADPGLITMVLDKMHSGAWPVIPVHLSVQANTTNHTAVKFWQKIGVTRVILSRELSLDEVEAIRQACPDVELEVLVHGSLCIAYSGRCLLSGYFNRRDDTSMPSQRLGSDFSFANEQHQAEQSFAACGGTPRHPAADQVYLLEELERPGQLMPIMEDEHGTYIMNSKDLRAVEHVARLVQIGVNALKIEGRTKSRYYVARTTQIYRQAIDAAHTGQGFDPKLIAQLASLAPRGYTSGFLERRPSQDYQAYEAGGTQARPSECVGEVLRVVDAWAEIATQGAIAVGDTLELIHPAGNRMMPVTAMKDAQGQDLTATVGAAMRVWMPMESATHLVQGGWLAAHMR